MRVIYIHQYFVTPQEGGAVRSYYLAKGMVEDGIEVDLITAHNKDYYDLKIIDGIRVHYLPVFYYNHYGFGRRIRAFIRFVRKAKTLIQKLPRPDLMYITSTPLTTGLIGIWAKMKYALPYVFEVRDLWPEAPIQMGVVRNPLMIKFLYKLEKSIYRHALKVVALSPGIKHYIEKSSHETKVYLIPNFADIDFFEPYQNSNVKSMRPLTISYAGAIGRVNALHEFVNMAAQAQYHQKNWHFNIMGSGADVPRLQRLAEEKGLRNLSFLPFGNKEAVRDLMERSDVMYISFAHHPVLRTNSPNKFFDALAMGKPLIINHEGWVEELIHNHKLGVLFDAQEPEKSWSLLETFMEDKEARELARKNARALAENSFSSDFAVKRVLNVINPTKHPLKVNDGVYIRTA
ncbi:glycosyltransferase family 4 protein [Litoribacter populi]|uniref:glycosyltransferase family 4 protein n=1 Tax=Litoribacter populi TaxID=2598460 RepID=UPI00117F3854|nr:glycosyltransferase family 4 protein [Litoribacter populi]